MYARQPSVARHCAQQAWKDEVSRIKCLMSSWLNAVLLCVGVSQLASPAAADAAAVVVAKAARTAQIIARTAHLTRSHNKNRRRAWVPRSPSDLEFRDYSCITNSLPLGADFPPDTAVCVIFK